jgi:hypothetical protein
MKSMKKKSKVRIYVKRGKLEGYSVNDSIKARRSILKKLLQKNPYASIIKRLNVLSIYNKNRYPETSKKVKSDISYIQKKYYNLSKTSLRKKYSPKRVSSMKKSISKKKKRVSSMKKSISKKKKRVSMKKSISKKKRPSMKKRVSIKKSVSKKRSILKGGKYINTCPRCPFCMRGMRGMRGMRCRRRVCLPN